MQEPYIRTFIRNRWGDARKALSYDDPDFVQSVEQYRFLIESKSLVLPQKVLAPNQRLSSRWHKLLEASIVVLEELDRIQITTTLLTPQIEKKLAHYYFDVWIQVAVNLCYKLKLLVTHCCRLYHLNDNIRKKFHQEIDSREVQGEISNLRHPLVHGEGQKGTVAKRAIGDEQKGWEFYVAVGSGGLDYFFEYDPIRNQGLNSQNWHDLVKRLTKILLNNLGNVLLRLDQKISSLDG